MQLWWAAKNFLVEVERMMCWMFMYVSAQATVTYKLKRNESPISKICQKIQTAEKRGNVSFFHYMELLLISLNIKIKTPKRWWLRWWWNNCRIGGGPCFSINKYLFVLLSLIFFLLSIFFFLSFAIFCGWLKEFENKAIELPRSTGPTTIRASSSGEANAPES